jgi:hypothetical protein
MPGWVGWTLVPEDYMPSSDTLVSAVLLRPGRTRSSTLAKSAPVGPCHVACTAATNTNDSVSTRPQRQTNTQVPFAQPQSLVAVIDRGGKDGSQSPRTSCCQTTSLLHSLPFVHLVLVMVVVTPYDVLMLQCL